MSILLLFLAGALGALAKDILKDNKLELPKISEGKVCLGFIGGVVLGGITGYFVDSSFLTAALAGYTGSAIIPNLISTGEKKESINNIIIAGIIRAIAKQEGIDQDLAVRVAKCESSLSPSAKNTNKDGSIDRGLFQINNKYHPEVTDKQAFDIILSTQFFCKAFKEGHLDWWNATKECWNIDKLA